MAETEMYFESLDEIAKFLNMPLDELCRMRNAGTFPVAPRAKNCALVYHRADVQKWDTAGRPYGSRWSLGVL